MKNLIPMAFALACFGANAKDIRTCQDAGVGLTTLSFRPARIPARFTTIEWLFSRLT
jgi:hypothetical protein